MGWTADRKWKQQWLTIQDEYEGYEQALSYVKAQESRAKERKKNEESVLRALRKKRQAAQMAQTVARHGDDYARLKEARLATRAECRMILPREITLNMKKEEQNPKSRRFSGDRTRSGTTSKAPRITTPTWTHATDSTDRLDLTTLLQSSTNARGRPRTFVFAGTDYGVVKMNVPEANSAHDMDQDQDQDQDQNRDRDQSMDHGHGQAYDQDECLIQDQGFEQAMSLDQSQVQDSEQNQRRGGRPGHEQGCEEYSGQGLTENQTQNLGLDQGLDRAHGQRQGERDGFGGQQRIAQLQALKLAPSHKIIAGKIDDNSHSRKVAKTREARLESNNAALEALQDHSRKEHALQRALSVQEVHLAQNTRRMHRQVLREFEHQSPEIKTNTASGSERSGHGTKWQPRSAATPPPTPGTFPLIPRPSGYIMPVLFIGDAGTGVGSRIKGHARRGGGKMRSAHRRYCPVAITDELRTSKTCAYCQTQVRLARSKRVDKEKKLIKTVNVNGAIECYNPDCVSVVCGYVIKLHDPHAAVNIALAGASPHLDSSRCALPPYTRSFRRTTTNDTGPLPPDPITPPTSVSDATRAGSDCLVS
ncbi:unnamed protein product [Mortierella alpina]